MTLPPNTARWTNDQRYELQERAAIKEFDAGMTQIRAMAQAERETRDAYASR